MSTERFVVLGLAHTRSSWFAELGRWSTSAVVPVDFVKCLSAEEVRVRLGSGRPFSALLIDGGHHGLDRDLIERASDVGCVTIVVADGRITRDWSELGAIATLEPEFDRGDLLEALGAGAQPIGDVVDRIHGEVASPIEGGWRGRLIAVTGVAGCGASVLAGAMAQAYGTDPRTAGRVALADLALDSSQALFHGAGDVMPAISELVEAHRTGLPTNDEVLALTFTVPDRGYRLLLGLRRRGDWVGLRPRAVAASVDSLRRCHQVVIADVGADVEGADDCGSVEIEERNVLARTVHQRADVVVIVASTDMKGQSGAVRVVHALAEFGVPTERMVIAFNRTTKRSAGRAAVTESVHALLEPMLGDRATPPVIFVPARKRLEQIHVDQARLPSELGRVLLGAADAITEREGHRLDDGGLDMPERIEPGTFGRWTGS